LYEILHELRANRNLAPAIDWVNSNSEVLESHGSNLCFDLCRLQFIQHFFGINESPNLADGPLRALIHAPDVFRPFQYRHAAEIAELVGILAFWDDPLNSPHKHVFQNDRWDEVASRFTKEFCSLLGLGENSSLYVAATAGGFALPLLVEI
jgi:E3 ubiquitin-protein transferase RMND5